MTGNSEATSASAVVKPETKRWIESYPQTQNYFDDEELPTRKLIKFDKPFLFPSKMNLTDVWVVIVLKAGFTTEERNKRWSAVFTKKYLRLDYVNKGRTRKGFSTTRNEWVYRVACNKYQLFDTKGATNGFIKEIIIGTGKISSKGDLAEGDSCHVPGNYYKSPARAQLPTENG